MSPPWEPALVEAAARVLGVKLSVIPDRRRSLLEMARQRAAERGFASVADWVQALSDPRVLAAESPAFVRVATVGFTYFDRDRGQLDALAASLARLQRPVRVWSAGCSSGEEAYTLAMALTDQSVSFSIYGTDVDPVRLEVARGARYTDERLQRLSPSARRRFFSPDAPGVSVVAADLREHVDFGVHNLAEDPPPKGRFDAIVCRNVLMYFTAEAMERVLAGFRRVLVPGGVVLFAGHEVPPTSSWGRRDDGALLAWAPKVAVRAGAGPSEARRVAPLPARPARTLSLVGVATPSPGGGPSITPQPTPRRTRAHAEVATSIGHRPAGSAVPSEAPSEASSAVRVLIERATVGLAEHRWREALDDFSAALALSPDWPEIHYLLGVLHRKTGDLDQSRRALRRALYLDDQFWPAAWMLAGLLDPRADARQLDRLRSGALADARQRPLETLFRVRDGAAWSPTPEQLDAHPHASRWRR